MTRRVKAGRGFTVSVEPTLASELTESLKLATNRPVSAVYSRDSMPQLLPTVCAVGTGGVDNALYYRRMYRLPIGYQGYQIVVVSSASPVARPYAELMQVIKSGFGRTMVRLPEVFGVSRPTICNWMNGEMPKPVHHGRLLQLAEAAKIFSAHGLKPTTLALDRTIMRGKSFLRLLSEGADGREVAQKLVRVVQRGDDAKAKLDGILGGRKARLEASDMGAPSFDDAKAFGKASNKEWSNYNQNSGTQSFLDALDEKRPKR